MTREEQLLLSLRTRLQQVANVLDGNSTYATILTNVETLITSIEATDIDEKQQLIQSIRTVLNDPDTTLADLQALDNVRQ